MPSKLQKAIGAVKDQTSLSLAKVAKSHSIDVAVLKATSHDDVPVDDRHVAEVLALVSSDPTRVKSCAQAIARRVGRTRNWVVALKSLVLVERVLQNDVVSFPKEVHNANIFNSKNFRDDSNSSPRDLFVGAFAHYLHDRVESILTGRLGDHPILLEKIVTWQRLLDRVIGVKPVGSSKNNRLVQNSLYGVVRESFDLHRNVSDGLALLLDTFFNLPYDSRANAFQAFLKASKQFEELSEFYESCKRIGVGTTSEYPNVQNMSEELLGTLREFLKDQSNFTCPSPSPTDNVPDFDATYRPDGDDDGSGSSIPVDRASISRSVLDSASLDDDRTILESRRQERRDQSGHGYKQSWEIELLDESKSTDPKQCVDLDILSQATPSQRWTNPFLNELASSLPSTPEDQSGFHFPANSSSPATHDRYDPFDAPSEPTFLEMPLQNDPFVEEIPLQSDAFAHVPPSQRHSIAHMPLQMSLHNDPFGLAIPTQSQNVPFPLATPPQSHITTPMPLHNDSSAPATPPQRHNILQLENDPFTPPTTPPQHHDTTQMSLHNDPFAPTTPSQSHITAQLPQQHNDPFVPTTPLSVQKHSFPPATQPQRHSASARDTNQPTFQTPPTFSANESNTNSTLQNEDDPFTATATSEGQDISHEKQLWLEYQNKIIAKHRT